ncbi:hypothetical protein [Deinococcus daejeonensis]|uniref:Uncharacterized protein n=1 Tax=Deinococcus daejeonensis TaxID=1007098 RepID=A0ABQ2IZ81_9DEIO|nr:hypothetical protein [Deinococcus daejeonensis]GGN34690.1 hypothetical protein GCM10010842_13650 [Deinococcus daejeonensis]
MQFSEAFFLSWKEQIFPLLPDLSSGLFQQAGEKRAFEGKRLEEILLLLRSVLSQVVKDPAEQGRHQTPACREARLRNGRAYAFTLVTSSYQALEHNSLTFDVLNGGSDLLAACRYEEGGTGWNLHTVGSYSAAQTAAD